MNDSPVARAEVEADVSRLLNLHDGPEALPRVISWGGHAIPALERLLRGPSQALYHSRTWAADALAVIGGPFADEALTRALTDSAHRTLFAQLREAEDVVVSSIADHLSQTSDPHSVGALLEALGTRAYPGCVRALGRIGDSRAIPLLVRCLGDDSTRAAAVDALRRFGCAALSAVIEVLSDIRQVNGVEPPSWIDARIAAAELLGAWALQSHGWVESDRTLGLQALNAAVHDVQRAVRIAAALALTRCRPRAQNAIRVLVCALDDPEWRTVTPVMHALVRLGAVIESALFETIGSQSATESAARRRRRAVWIAGRLGTPEAARVLTSVVASADAPLRLALVTALDHIPDTNPSALKSYLGDPDATVRRRAVAALNRRRALSPEWAVLLLGDHDSEVRHAATVSLHEQREMARRTLSRAVLTLGMPLRGWAARLRLSWNAARWLLKADHQP